MIFVDTGAWFATLVPADRDHEAAARWLSQNTSSLFTTDYVVDETLTLLRARHEPSRAITFGDLVFAGTLATVYRLTERDIERAWQIFREFTDKDWSFTDCTSKAVIESLEIHQAFAFHQHFRQFGNVEVVP